MQVMDFPEHVYAATVSAAKPEITEEQPQPSIGDIVLYVLPDGQIRPAIIVRLWSAACVNLQVFLDGNNDYLSMGTGGNTGTRWKTSVYYSEGKEPGTWHYKEAV
jgi:hypothetical protein